MRALSDWLEAYGESHQNPINQKIHKVAVPGIYLSVVGLIWSIPQLSILGFSSTGFGALSFRFGSFTSVYLSVCS